MKAINNLRPNAKITKISDKPFIAIIRVVRWLFKQEKGEMRCT